MAKNVLNTEKVVKIDNLKDLENITTEIQEATEEATEPTEEATAEDLLSPFFNFFATQKNWQGIAKLDAIAEKYKEFKNIIVIDEADLKTQILSSETGEGIFLPRYTLDHPFWGIKDLKFNEELDKSLTDFFISKQADIDAAIVTSTAKIKKLILAEADAEKNKIKIFDFIKTPTFLEEVKNFKINLVSTGLNLPLEFVTEVLNLQKPTSTVARKKQDVSKLFKFTLDEQEYILNIQTDGNGTAAWMQAINPTITYNKNRKAYYMDYTPTNMDRGDLWRKLVAGATPEQLKSLKNKILVSDFLSDVDSGSNWYLTK